MQSSTDDLVGQVLEGRYEIRRLLGQGGMGRVYLAEQIKMHRLCALKVMHAEQMHDTDAAGRFGREALNASRIVHPHVATIYDFGETNDGLLYIAMEYVDGCPLSDLLTREGALAVDRAVDIALQIGQALGAAHELGIVHRDLKPDNVMLTTDRAGRDVVKVVDFGIAKAAQGAGQTITRTGLIVGTPQYMSPEQIAGDPLDGRSDLYALGCILFKMLTGTEPFTGTGQEILMRRLVEAPPHPRSLKPDIPSNLDEVIVRALARFPRDRFDSAEALCGALSAARTTPAETPQPRPAPPPAPASPTVAEPQAPAISRESQPRVVASPRVADVSRPPTPAEFTPRVVVAATAPAAASPVSVERTPPVVTAGAPAAAASIVEKRQFPQWAVPGGIAVVAVAAAVAFAMHRTPSSPVVPQVTQPLRQPIPLIGRTPSLPVPETSATVAAQTSGSHRDVPPRPKSPDVGNAAAARVASALAMYDRGNAALRIKNYGEATQDFQQAANAGNVDAMVALARSYNLGEGVARDTGQSRLWYQRAATAGNLDAMTWLGYSAMAARDSQTAQTWLEKAAAGGDGAAMDGLGGMYEYGRGVVVNFPVARKWYEQGSAAGNTDAMKRLGDMYLTARGVPQDYAQAHQLYEKAASAGNTAAMNAIGFLYFRGLGVSQDYQQARHWYQSAAVGGNAGGMYALGTLYEEGWGVPRDYAQARDWYEQAAARGDMAGAFKLGTFYEVGHGVPRDFQQARTWYEKAVAAGNPGAMYRLGQLLEYGEGGPKDTERAFQLYQDAATRGNKPAIDRLQKAGRWPATH